MSSTESIIRSNVGSGIGRSIGSSVESSIGISMGSKEIVLNFCIPEFWIKAF